MSNATLETGYYPRGWETTSPSTPADGWQAAKLSPAAPTKNTTPLPPVTRQHSVVNDFCFPRALIVIPAIFAFLMTILAVRYLFSNAPAAYLFALLAVMMFIVTAASFTARRLLTK